MISVRLALVFALRMFGLFVVLPVLAPYALTFAFGWRRGEYARKMGMAIGLAMGVWPDAGVLYIPYGLASDRFGRNR